MADLLDLIRKQASAPVRRVLEIFVRQDPGGGPPISTPLSSQETVLSKDGSPDTIRVSYAQFHSCGHALETPLGGECFECQALSCQTCHGQCADCKKPLCLSCSRFESFGSADSIRRCRACSEKAARQQRWKRLGTCLVSPFVELNRREDR